MEHNPHILIVDDHRDIRDGLVRYLEKNGFRTTAARDASELAAIDQALQRLDTPDFGICIDCGAEIESARLLAEPTVLRCTACQQRFEHQHHTPGGARL